MTVIKTARTFAAGLAVAGIAAFGTTTPAQAWDPAVAMAVDHYIECSIYLLTDWQAHEENCLPSRNGTRSLNGSAGSVVPGEEEKECVMTEFSRGNSDCCIIPDFTILQLDEGCIPY